MQIEVHCYNCNKEWRQHVEVEVHSAIEIHIVGMDFCLSCRRRMVREFRSQFDAKLLLPKLHHEEADAM